MSDSLKVLTLHPVADLFPAMRPDEFDGLVADIRARGVRVPVVVKDGQILDGHHRYRACQQLGVECPTVEWNGEDDWLEAQSLNLHRRHILKEQVYAVLKVAAERFPELAAPLKQAKAEAKERQREGGKKAGRGRSKKGDSLRSHDRNLSESADAIGKPLGVSGATVKRVDRVATAAPDLLPQIAEGKISTGRALREVRRRERTKRKDAKPGAQNAALENCRFLCGDFTASGVESASIDCIITDPPYSREALPLYEQLGTFAARVLKPGGSCIVMVGQSYLPEIMSTMAGSGLTYQWCLAYLTPGGQSVQLWQRKVNTFWKPLLWYVKGEYGGDWIGDVCKSAVNDNDKRFHDWGQSESGMADIIDRFTDVGQMILDPFLGGGTTGLVAVAKGRHFIGIDIDASTVETARVRIGEALA